MPRAPELTRTFGGVFVINLPQRRDRYAEMQEQLARAGLGWSSPGVHLVPALRPSDDGGFASIGAHGCYMSHVAAIERALALGLDSMLLLEDDCNLVRDFDARFAAVATALARTDWSIFYGGWRLPDGEPFGPGDAGPLASVETRRALWLTHCLAFRGAALRALPSYLRDLASRPSGDAAGGRMHVDGAYTWFRRAHPEFETCAATPPIAFQRASRSDVDALRWRDRLPLFRGAVAAARRWANRRRG